MTSENVLDSIVEMAGGTLNEFLSTGCNVASVRLYGQLKDRRELCNVSSSETRKESLLGPKPSLVRNERSVDWLERSPALSSPFLAERPSDRKDLDNLGKAQ
jgi:hypothetical protein